MGSDMPAETLNCPMCGASASTDAPRCEHCGARLATVACPSCFGMMFVGQKFCSHCGVEAIRAEVEENRILRCPRCRTGMEASVVGVVSLQECSKCEGLWADADSLEKLCADREKQAAVLGSATPLPENEGLSLERNIRYVPCPECKKLMNRVNFAKCSHIVVDVCKEHGTWFDKDELRRVIEFIRGGGLEQARAREIAELEEERRQTKTARITSSWSPPIIGTEPSSDFRDEGIFAIAKAIRSLFGR